MGFNNIGFVFNLFKFLLLLSFLCTVKAIINPEVEDEPEFSYCVGAPNGPENWGNLTPNWALCGTGRSQSPINIQTRNVVPSRGGLIRLYQPAQAILKNKGKEIEVEWTGDAGGIVINGTEYKLVQCHWHIPAEHTVNGISYAMEIHMVHMSVQENIAVVGIHYTEGRPDWFIDENILPNLNSATQEGFHLGVVDPTDIGFPRSGYYRYNGSLTTPPCSENLTWTIFKQVKTASRHQIRAIRKAAYETIDTGNARPTQPLNGRTVTCFDQPYLSKLYETM